MRAALLGLVGTLVAIAIAADILASTARGAQDMRTAAKPSSCVECHAGIEPMHPEADLSCVDCHGGNPAMRRKIDAHVPEPQTQGDDNERVAPLDKNLAWIRFANPMDLRVTSKTCASCHADMVDRLHTSLHGTTAGHLSDGYYEMGLFEERGSRYGVFPVSRGLEPGGAVESLKQVPPFQSWLPADELPTHFTDLARKECMQCHLWSEGRAVRGRVGFDGDYRGAGCAACHVPYATDGLSRSRDAKIAKSEPGHPRTHSMVRAAPTETCTSCHYGDASIGLHFRGLSQLPPGAPGGPDIPGTTDSPLNRVFYVNDPKLTPPDVHHEKGMHCVDCHTLGDVMGDGKLHGQMEHAVEISCEGCHGTFTEPSNLRTERGTPIENLVRRGAEQDEVVLVSKVDGKEHPVPQVVHVLDETRPEYNPRAAEAMRPVHGDLECYTCHAGWNVNFLGFHFDRNESLTQLDLLSGRRTAGRVTTQEKVFATWKSFYSGLNEAGRYAPYLTGFSTMGTVRDKDGETVLDQVMPVTSKGLSGLTMIHHQLHSTRPTARSCVECHRTSTTWGMGSVNFRLARRLAFVADRRGIEVVAVERSQLGASPPLAKFVLPDVVAMELDCEPLQGHAQTLFAAEGGRGVHALDVSDPAHPKRLDFVASVNPREMQLAGDHLYLADGVGGLKVYDVSDPSEMRQVAVVPMFDAHDVHVQWPWAYVADGPGGLVVLDVRAPIAPRILAGVDLNGESTAPNEALQVSNIFQYSRPMAVNDVPVDTRTEARNVCVVLDERRGLVLVDVTRPDRPELLYPRPDPRSSSTGAANITYRGLAVASHVDLAEPGGGRTGESDYAYVLRELRRRNGQRSSRVEIWDIGDPRRPERVGITPAGNATEMVELAAWYSPPFLRTMLLVPSAQGLGIRDATISREPTDAGTFPGILSAYVVAVEEFPLDQMIEVTGEPLKDVSHEGSRWLHRSEIERILSVSDEELGLEPKEEDPAPPPGLTARLFLERLDADGSGLLEATEAGAAGASSLDVDGDGRVTLGELAGFAGLIDDEGYRGAEADEASAFLDARVGPDGDLARLLDGVNPWDLDGDDDAGLSRGEVERAFFTALDLDGSGSLDPGELSRHPGPLRRLRFGDAAARELFETVDTNSDGRVSTVEFKLRDLEWNALDQDLDGEVSLGRRPMLLARRHGIVDQDAEWPGRRFAITGLPPLVRVDQLLEALDGNRDGEIAQRELRRRPGLFRELDLDGNGSADEEELQIAVDRALQFGVEIGPDAFADRWDLDGDGRLEPAELPIGERLGLMARAKRP